ncbi:MAG: hypothetical protein ACYC7F_01010 [Gemmatimonadaceae bacterium]
MPRIVIADTNVLINLAIADALPLLAQVPDTRFVVCAEVLGELTDPAQAAAVQSSLAKGALSVVGFEATEELATYAALRRIMGQGEAAALALAEHRGFAIASDEKRVFRREAIARLGADRIVTTADVFVACIRRGAITIDDADDALRTLAANRFTLPFTSVRDVL